jgi:hypothetical protein
MRADITADLAALGVRPLEDAHLVWFSAELESGRALQAWFASTGSPGEAAAYATYRAALDREEAAARALEGRLRVV